LSKPCADCRLVAFIRVLKITPQATLAPILKKEDGLIDFSRQAGEILNRLRGFQPWPGAYTKFRGKNLQIWKASSLDRSLPTSELTPEADHLFVGCGESTAIELLEVQLEGKKANVPLLTLFAAIVSSPARRSARNAARLFSPRRLLPSYWRE
jgi:hypothetical protein